MKPSRHHSNRGLKNWLAYDVGDRCLIQYSRYLRGDLYDLGCGEAPHKDYFLSFVDTYTGVDWSRTLHDSKADVVSDLNVRIDLEDEVADSIISLSVMEHLSEPQVFLNESFRILRAGSFMVLQVPWQWWIHEAPHDYFRYSPYALRHMFAKAGFADVEVEAQTGFFTMIVLKLNYFTARFVKGPRLLRFLIQVILVPFWTLGQLLAPLLDKLDRNWAAETQGYVVLAKKN